MTRHLLGLAALLLLSACGDLPYRLEIGFKNSPHRPQASSTPKKSEVNAWIAWETLHQDLQRAFKLRSRGDPPPKGMIETCQRAAKALQQYFPGQVELFERVEERYQSLVEKAQYSPRSWTRRELRRIRADVESLLASDQPEEHPANETPPD